MTALDGGGFVEERAHPNPERYGHERQLIVEVDGYPWVVSFVTDGATIFFKTMYPSRKANKEYLRG